MKNKKIITLIIVGITLCLLLLLTILLKPRAKTKGSFSDTLESSSITTRIVATNLVKDDTKTMLEVVISIWNRGNDEIEITNNTFSYNTTNPTNKIGYKIGKNERINIRQLYEYTGAVQKYTVSVRNTVFEFDFILKNNELSQKNIELAQSSTKESLKEMLDKSEKEATAEREKKIAQIKEENKQLEREAQKEAENQKTAIFGKYISRNVGDETIIHVNSDYSASIHIACEATPKDRYIGKLDMHFENNTYTFEGTYKENTMTKKIKFTIVDKKLRVIESEDTCLLETTYSKI